MNISEKLEKVFAPLDVVEIKKKYEYIWPKDKEVDLPEGFLEEAKVYLGTGEYPDRNPTCWWIFEGEKHDTSTILIRYVHGQENTTCLTFARKEACVVDIYDLQSQDTLNEFHVSVETLVNKFGGTSHWGKY